MSRLDGQARSLTRYFQRRAHRGAPEARRDWLYAPALVPGGAWNADARLDEVIRRAKDLGPAIGFELVYVYWRPPVWTCDPSDEVRALAVLMEMKREAAAEDRLARTMPAGGALALVTAGVAANLHAAEVMVTALLPPGSAPPPNDPVIARIDAIPGLAN